jgi:two-component system response regulator AgrA
MNIVICEDDNSFRINLTNYIKKVIVGLNISGNMVINTNSPDEVIKYIKEQKYFTLYFLDVDLNNKYTGFDIAKKIRENDWRSIIVFITAYANKAPLTYKYKLQALDYIIKTSDNLYENISECIMIANSLLNTETQKELRLLGKRGLISIPFNDIYYIESSNSLHKITINYKNGHYEGRGSLKDIFEKLDERFVYCHKSFIINKEKITSTDTNVRKIIFNDNSFCWYSKNYAKEVKKWLQ